MSERNLVDRGLQEPDLVLRELSFPREQETATARGLPKADGVGRADVVQHSLLTTVPFQGQVEKVTHSYTNIDPVDEPQEVVRPGQDEADQVEHGDHKVDGGDPDAANHPVGLYRVMQS